jgi:peptidoglycan hydrolase-like protein with peptidoglycan-binding domain
MPPPYQQGSQGRDIEKLQTRLKELGLYLGRVDGDFGPKTETAIKAFQASADLPVDGIASLELWTRLFPRQPVMLSYQKQGLTLMRGGAALIKDQIKDLQRDLRRLGYLKEGIDGDFGQETERAVKALQYDLLFNGGQGKGDGSAPVCLTDLNRGRVTAVTGSVDQGLVGCIADLLNTAACPMLPSALDPAEENRKFRAAVAGLQAADVPIPFLLAILKQESGFKHFREPAPGDEDTYIVVGLDRNLKEGSPHKDYAITSRGYGAGQYTLFHHPPRSEEVQDFMLDPVKNVQKAIIELREKFDRFVNGPTDRADDRIKEYGSGPLRRCKFGPDDPKYMKDCKQCLRDAGLRDVKSGETPWYEGSTGKFEPTTYYETASYQDVPVRRNIGCDWPYAVRRYNGGGPNSYHYQVRVLKHLFVLDRV